MGYGMDAYADKDQYGRKCKLYVSEKMIGKWYRTTRGHAVAPCSDLGLLYRRSQWIAVLRIELRGRLPHIR